MKITQIIISSLLPIIFFGCDVNTPKLEITTKTIGGIETMKILSKEDKEITIKKVTINNSYIAVFGPFWTTLTGC